MQSRQLLSRPGCKTVRAWSRCNRAMMLLCVTVRITRRRKIKSTTPLDAPSAVRRASVGYKHPLPTRSIDVAQLPTKCGLNNEQSKSSKAGDQKHSLSEQVSPAHRRVAVRTTPFDVNGHLRPLLFPIYGWHKSVSDRSWQTIRSAAGREIAIDKRRTPSEVQSRQLMSRSSWAW